MNFSALMILLTILFVIAYYFFNWTMEFDSDSDPTYDFQRKSRAGYMIVGGSMALLFVSQLSYPTSSFVHYYSIITCTLLSGLTFVSLILNPGSFYYIRPYVFNQQITGLRLYRSMESLFRLKKSEIEIEPVIISVSMYSHELNTKDDTYYFCCPSYSFVKYKRFLSGSKEVYRKFLMGKPLEPGEQKLIFKDQGERGGRHGASSECLAGFIDSHFNMLKRYKDAPRGSKFRVRDNLSYIMNTYFQLAGNETEINLSKNFVSNNFASIDTWSTKYKQL